MAKDAQLCLIQHCPVYNDIAPYFAIIVNDAHATVNSINRSDASAALLHKYGKHTQRELFVHWQNGDPGYYPANPPGFSSHERKSDGIPFWGVPRGGDLAWWQQGMDVNDADVNNCIAQAASHGWKLVRPYSSGSEYHHLNFAVRPAPTPRTVLRIHRLRATLPRS